MMQLDFPGIMPVLRAIQPKTRKLCWIQATETELKK